MKYLLSVAINAYKVAPLRGCINDSNHMAELYRQNGYEIIQLLDDAATRSNIIASLTELASTLVAGSKFVFCYSGHGSQLPSCDDTEEDGLTEILCPFDLINADGSWSDNFITDNELHYLFDAFKVGVDIECLIDSCHSGSITRDIKPDVRYRYVECKIATPVKLVNKDISGNREVICWSGCLDSQTSADAFIDGIYQGAFTASFLKTEGTRGNRYLAMLTDMKAVGYTQLPQLTCSEAALHLPLF